MIYDVALLTEPFIEVNIAVISVPGTFDSSFYFCTIRKFKRDLSGIPAGIEID
jgi:hypothetical protein